MIQCLLCHGIFRTHSEFVNHVQTIHPLTVLDAILNSHVDASGILLQNSSAQRNDRIVVPSTTPSNHYQPIRRARTPPIDRQHMARQNRVVTISRGSTPPTNTQQMARNIEIEGSNSTFADSNELDDFTKPLINQLDVPISSNADDLVNIVEEQNDLDLTLKL
ncbi:hypothetical protein FXO38_05664 [Capsicum annuum]|nr:hypothetical protein FXO37_08624 [Capsicum annuum]KAF3673341.1 hypothetical protein FXO38_05664 [Capsicum annuum]